MPLRKLGRAWERLSVDARMGTLIATAAFVFLASMAVMSYVAVSSSSTSSHAVSSANSAAAAATSAQSAANDAKAASDGTQALLKLYHEQALATAAQQARGQKELPGILRRLSNAIAAQDIAAINRATMQIERYFAAHPVVFVPAKTGSSASPPVTTVAPVVTPTTVVTTTTTTTTTIPPCLKHHCKSNG